MLPIYIKNIYTDEIVHINPEEDPQKWNRAILHEFSRMEVELMRYQYFEYMLDALRRSTNCQPGNYFILFEREQGKVREDVVYEIVSCTEDRLVCKPFEGTEQITFEGDELHNYLMLFLQYEGEAEE